jgi:hypothetical protein
MRNLMMRDQSNPDLLIFTRGMDAAQPLKNKKNRKEGGGLWK